MGNYPMHFRTILLVATILGGAGTANAQTAEQPETPAATPEPGENETIVVSGIRRSITGSIRTKREANSIVDVVTAEDVGKFPDNNVAESLSRVPGITV